MLTLSVYWKLTLLDEAANSPQTFVGCGFTIFSPLFKAFVVLFEFILRILAVGCLGPEWGLSIQVWCVIWGQKHPCSVWERFRSLYTTWVDFVAHSLLTVLLHHFPEACYFSAPTRKLLGLCFPALSHKSILIHKPSGGRQGRQRR